MYSTSSPRTSRRCSLIRPPRTRTSQTGRSATTTRTAYYWIDTQKVPEVKHRQALGVALDRDALRTNSGGDFAGALGDGVIKPNLGSQYAETGWGPKCSARRSRIRRSRVREAAASGNQARSSGPDVGLPDDPGQEEGGPIVSSRWGSRDQGNGAADPGCQYYSVVFDPAQSGDFGAGGRGADWPNASNVIAPLFTDRGGWNPPTSRHRGQPSR